MAAILAAAAAAVEVHGAANKVIPCRFMLISQQRIGILARKFTRLFLIHLYA